MRLTGWTVLLYGILNIMGGILGFQKAKSVPSLIFGITFGALLIGSSISIFNQKLRGYYCALAFTFILDSFFSYRFLTKQKFFPSGFMSIISLVVFFIIAYGVKKLNAYKNLSEEN